MANLNVSIAKSASPYYPDVHLMLILVPLISAFNYALTYSNIHLNWFLALTFTLDTLQGYVAWWGVRAFILYLDKKLPYTQNMSQRLIAQLVGSLGIGLLIISILTELVCLIARGTFVPLHFYTHDLPIISIWFFVINGIYVGIYFFKAWQSLNNDASKEQNSFWIRNGKNEIQLPFHELAGIYVDGDYSVVCDTNGKKYYQDISLAQIEKQLPAQLFYRLNRQYLLHYQMITGFKKEKNGKLEVLIRPHQLLPAQTKVSRTKASAFKSWFKARQ